MAKKTFTEFGEITPVFDKKNTLKHQKSERDILFGATDALFKTLSKFTVAQTIQPEYTSEVYNAYQTFASRMEKYANWFFTPAAYADLQERKDGKLRQDSFTPSDYHEYRQCIMKLALMRSGKTDLNALHYYGGPDVRQAITWHHDTSEDTDQSPLALYSSFEKALHQKHSDLGDERFQVLTAQNGQFSSGVDLMSKKYNKKDRFPTTPELYYQRQRERPPSLIDKYCDRIENLSTTIVPGALNNSGLKFSVQHNASYVSETEKMFHNAHEDTMDNYPDFADTVEVLDLTTQKLCAVVKLVNYEYSSAKNKTAPEYDPLSKTPNDFMTLTSGLSPLPASMNPFEVQVMHLERQAAWEKQNNKEPKMRKLLDDVIYPFYWPLLEKKTTANDLTHDIGQSLN